MRQILGYFLGFAIFIAGIPAMMWWVAGWPAFAEIPAWRLYAAGVMALAGLALSVWSIVYMKRVGKGNPFDAMGHEVAPRTRHLMTGGPYRLSRNPMLSGTYLYYLGDVRFPFGRGLSYTAFRYEDFRMNRAVYDADDTMEISCTVTNTGACAGAAVPQLYFRKIALYDNKPLRQLIGFRKIQLLPGESRCITFTVPVSECRFWNSWKHRFEVEEGEYAFWIGEDCEDLTSTPKRFPLSSHPAMIPSSESTAER